MVSHWSSLQILYKICNIEYEVYYITYIYFGGFSPLGNPHQILLSILSVSGHHRWSVRNPKSKISISKNPKSKIQTPGVLPQPNPYTILITRWSVNGRHQWSLNFQFVIFIYRFIHITIMSSIVNIIQSQPAVVYFLQAGLLFFREDTKFWPVLANLGYFVANMGIFGVLFKGLNSAVVYQN